MKKINNKALILKTIRLNIKKYYKSYVITVQKIKPSELFIVLQKEIEILQEMEFSIASIKRIIKKTTNYEYSYITLYRLIKDHIIGKEKEISLPQPQKQQVMIETKLKCLIN